MKNKFNDFFQIIDNHFKYGKDANNALKSLAGLMALSEGNTILNDSEWQKILKMEIERMTRLK